jgi:hypothetical protein
LTGPQPWLLLSPTKIPDVTENHTALDIVPLSCAFYGPVLVLRPCASILVMCLCSASGPSCCFLHEVFLIAPSPNRSVSILSTHAKLSTDGALSSCGSKERQRSVACYPSQAESRRPSRTPRHSDSDTMHVSCHLLDNVGVCPRLF